MRDSNPGKTARGTCNPRMTALLPLAMASQSNKIKRKVCSMYDRLSKKDVIINWCLVAIFIAGLVWEYTL